MHVQSPPDASIYKYFTKDQKNIFLLELAKGKPSNAVVIAVDKDQLITDSENDPLLLSKWLSIAIRAGITAKINVKAKNYVCSIGRINLILPIYLAWASVDKNVARQYFSQCNSFYHPLAFSTIENALK